MLARLRFRCLPWEYGVRNLLRRPGRSCLTLLAMTLVVLLIFVVLGFIHGLESSLAVSGDPQVALVHAPGAAEYLENSSIAAARADELAAGLKGVLRRPGPQGTSIPYVSPELFLGTEVTLTGHPPAMGLVRGVENSILLVRRRVQIVSGNWPGPGEVLVGRLAATKLGTTDDALTAGQKLVFEGRTWSISGRFAAAGSMLEAEVWCPLSDLKLAMKRQDVGMLALTMAPGTEFGDMESFFRKRPDLELETTLEAEHYRSLQKHYAPVRALAWLIVFLVAGAGTFVGLNTMYGAVVGRVRELATLQTLGFVRRAIALSLLQEGLLLGAASSLIAATIALVAINGLAVRFTMGAFTLQIDGPTLLLGCAAGALLGVVGAIPPALRAMRLPIVDGLKAI